MNQGQLLDLSQPKPGNCRRHSMTPMAYKWVNTAQDYVLALVEARCFECGLTLSFNHTPATPPPKSEAEAEANDNKKDKK